jgi:DNA-binding MarR family transcriptional regulator
MADIDELLRRQNEKLENKSGARRKKVARKGPLRPWQENLPQYQIEPDDAPKLLNNSNGENLTSEIVENVVQHGSNGPGSTGFNMVQKHQVEPGSATDNEVLHGSTEPCRTSLNLVQRGSKPGSTAPGRAISLGQLLVLRVIANKESSPYEPITLKKCEIAKETELTLDGVKTAIRRLLRKGALESVSYKGGQKFGGTIYKLTVISREILSSKMALNLTGFNMVQRGSEPGAAGYTSSSSKILDLTNNNWETTDREKITDLSKDPAWTRIDFDCLAQIGFNRSHVVQVASSKVLTPDSLQDSIYAFYFDLNVNQKGSKIGGPPLNFFMGILRRGPYSAPANYESPEDKQLREYLDAKENLLKKRRERLERLKALEFEEWVDSLPSMEVERLAPMGTTDVLKRSQLMNHFESHLWAEKRRLILESLKQKLVGERGAAFVESLENPLPDRGQLPPLNPP